MLVSTELWDVDTSKFEQHLIYSYQPVVTLTDVLWTVFTISQRYSSALHSMPIWADYNYLKFSRTDSRKKCGVWKYRWDNSSFLLSVLWFKERKTSFVHLLTIFYMKLDQLFSFPSAFYEGSCACSSKFKVHTNRSFSLPQKTLLLKHLVSRPLILLLCDITLHHHVAHLHNLCLAGSWACNYWCSTATLLLLAMLAQACMSWPIRAD